MRISLLVKKRKHDAASEIQEVTCVKLVDGKIPISSSIDGTSELLDKKLGGYGLSDTLGTQFASIDVAPTEVKCEFLKSSFFVVAVFIWSNRVIIRISMHREATTNPRMAPWGWGV